MKLRRTVHMRARLPKMYMGMPERRMPRWIIDRTRKTCLAPASVNHSMTKKLNIRPQGRFFIRLRETRASPAYWRYESTQKVLAVVLPNEHPKLTRPKQTVGTIQPSPASADQPKPISPLP